MFSALDVLEKKNAECQGHAYLFTALADLLPLIDWVGRLKIRVLAFEHQLQ